MRTPYIVVARCWLAVILSACGSSREDSSDDDDGAAPLQARVDIIQEVLNPEHVRVKSGGTVQWFNLDGQAHQLVSGVPGSSDTGEVFDSDVVIGPPGFQPFRDFTVTFSAIGNVDYYCIDHPGTLIGKVVVVP